MAGQAGRTRRYEGRGLVLKNPGGRTGWLARRFFPAFATRLYLAWIRLSRAGSTRRFIGEFTRSPTLPWFRHVELETINRCNGGCAFCPVSRGRDSRPYQKMEGGLFARIIDQLAEIDFDGYLGLFSNNEPLLDKRLPDFAAHARDRLPDVRLNLSTNGSLLDLDLFRKLLPHFDRMVINNYHDRPELFSNIQDIHDFCRGSEGNRLLAGKTLEICLRCSDDVLTTRAGAAPNRAGERVKVGLPCALPFSQLIVRPDGKVSLCCNDALGKMTLGDLSVQDIGEVWRGREFTAVRKGMLEKGREGLPLCRDCDFVKHEL